MKRIFRLMAALGLVLACAAQAQGDPATGRDKAAVCASCHGPDGNSTLAQWPKLAGQHAAYLERQIQLIRDGLRPVPEMAGIVAGLSDADIADLAAWYATQTISPGVANEELVDVGERLYRAGDIDRGIPACMACHGPAGEGNPLAAYPALAGQHALYTTNQLTRYHEGTTWGPEDGPSTVMVGVARELTVAEIAALASYIEGLHPATD